MRFECKEPRSLPLGSERQKSKDLIGGARNMISHLAKEPQMKGLFNRWEDSGGGGG